MSVRFWGGNSSRAGPFFFPVKDDKAGYWLIEDRSCNRLDVTEEWINPRKETIY